MVVGPDQARPGHLGRKFCDRFVCLCVECRKLFLVASRVSLTTIISLVLCSGIFILLALFHFLPK